MDGKETIINDSYAEKLLFETNSGIMVRSKSELMIANTLEAHSDLVCYKYEQPLVIGGITIYPDFIIMRKSDGRLFYWEHFGLMDNSDYTEKYVWKMNHYLLNGIVPGRDLICTYETLETPLTTRVINTIVDVYFMEE